MHNDSRKFAGQAVVKTPKLPDRYKFDACEPEGTGGNQLFKLRDRHSVQPLSHSKTRYGSCFHRRREHTANCDIAQLE